jgi:hypothetical protein
MSRRRTRAKRADTSPTGIRINRRFGENPLRGCMEGVFCRSSLLDLQDHLAELIAPLQVAVGFLE